MSLITVGNDVFPKNLMMFKKWSEKKNTEWLYSVTGTNIVEKEVSEFKKVIVTKISKVTDSLFCI